MGTGGRAGGLEGAERGCGGLTDLRSHQALPKRQSTVAATMFLGVGASSLLAFV